MAPWGSWVHLALLTESQKQSLRDEKELERGALYFFFSRGRSLGASSNMKVLLGELGSPSIHLRRGAVVVVRALQT